MKQCGQILRRGGSRPQNAKCPPSNQTGQIPPGWSLRGKSWELCPHRCKSVYLLAVFLEQLTYYFWASSAQWSAISLSLQRVLWELDEIMYVKQRRHLLHFGSFLLPIQLLCWLWDTQSGRKASKRKLKGRHGGEKQEFLGSGLSLLDRTISVNQTNTTCTWCLTCSQPTLAWRNTFAIGVIAS